MSLSAYLAFCLASFILVVLPGPNVSIIIANTLKHGTRTALVTVYGTASAMLIQLVIVVLGLSAILAVMGDALTYVKWIGVAYLIYIGYKSWVAPPQDLTNVKSQKPNKKHIFMHGFIVSMSNPKSLVFFGAFFPQFITDTGNATEQLIILSATFFTIATISDASWTVTVEYAKKLLLRSEQYVNKISGGFLMLGGVLLAMIEEK